ncbi:MAG: 23S rRNA pseudouridine(2604) synthase RluF [Pseudomonadota bacterium]|nr:23S rRNA pseudouridine(2604) synthase RluF [Pseudomonadota bacterium]
MRLNKFISETGVCSRREADGWIEQGRVTLNGAVAVLGTQVNNGDEVCVDGRPVGQSKKNVYIALNKPVGITCTTERHIADNIIDFVGHRDRIFPIGRLDKPSEGLILLTNNGDIVNEILRAEHDHEKEYIVTVDRPLTPEFVRHMAAGVEILDTLTKPCVVTAEGRNVFRITLTQGLNRQIRRMCDVFDYKVWRLQRVRIMNVHLGSLPIGQWRDLNADELRDLLPDKELVPSQTATPGQKPKAVEPRPKAVPKPRPSPASAPSDGRVDPWANARKRR